MKAKSDVLQRIKLAAEDEVLERIEEHPFYRRDIAHLVPRGTAKAEATDSNYGACLTEQLKSGAELTRVSYDTLFRLVDDAAATLGLTVSARLFKSSDPRGAENAFIVSAGDRVIIVFQSGILNAINSGELLRAIMGHELGHHGFGHLEAFAPHAVRNAEQMGVALLSQPGRRTKEEAEMIRLLRSDEFNELLTLAYLHSQLAELNADRAGLLAQPDLMTAIEGEMVLAGGAADSFGRYRAGEYLTQARELLASARPLFDISDVERTHPNGPHRALAQEYFHATDLYRELTGRGSASQRDADFPALLPWIVPLMEIKPRLRTCTTSLSPHPFLGAAGAAGVQPASAPSPSAPSASGGQAPPPPASETDLGVVRNADPAMTDLERAELCWLLGMHVVGVDGKVTAGEEAFMMTVVRPRALIEELLGRLEPLSDEQLVARRDDLLERARGLHGRTKTSLLKMLIQAAKADRKVTDDEVVAIAEIGELLGAKEVAARELRSVFGSRFDDVLARMSESV